MGRELRKLKGNFRNESAIIPAFLFILIIFYIPLGTILVKGIQNSQGDFSLEGINGILGSPYYRKIIFFTFFQALISTVLSVLIALPGAWFLSHVIFPGKRLIKAVITIPFILPSILVVLGFVLFYGNNGALNRLLKLAGLGELKILYSFKAIILAHIFYNVPIGIRIISTYWSRIPMNQVMAARSLGAGRVKVFVTVTLHQIFPALLTSAMIIFIYCFMSFAIILVLGGGPSLSTVEVEVYRLAKVTLDLNRGSSLALIQSGLTLFFMFIYSTLEKYKSYEEKLAGTGFSRIHHLKPDFRSIMTIVYFSLILLLIAAPPLSVIFNSFRMKATLSGGEHFSLHWYREIFLPSVRGSYSNLALTALKNSLLYGFSTILFTVPVSVVVARYIGSGNKIRSGLIELIFLLPMGVSSVILGMSYMRLSNMLPGNMRSGSMLVVLVHSAIALPLAFKPVLSIFRKIKNSIREGARNLGASDFRVFRDVELPLIKSGILTGATFSFAVSIGEMNATLMLSRQGTTTLPIAIYSLIGAYKFNGACALGTILMFICLIAFLAIDHFDGFGDSL